MLTLQIVLAILNIATLIVVFIFRPRPVSNLSTLDATLNKIFDQVEVFTNNQRKEFTISRQENSLAVAELRRELTETLSGFRREMTDTLRLITDQNRIGIEAIHKTLDEKITLLITKTETAHQILNEAITTGLDSFSLVQRNKFDEWQLVQKQGAKQMVEALEKISIGVEQKLLILNENAKADAVANRQTIENSFGQFNETLRHSVQDLNETQRQKFATMDDKQTQLVIRTEEKLTALTEQTKTDNNKQREATAASFKDFQTAFDKNVSDFNNLQREKFAGLEDKQHKLVEATERKLDGIRETVDEKLQRTLNERLGHSFGLVTTQLESVQKGLGEMQTLAQDVGGLKRVLTNVKMRGGFGEVQLHMLLDNVLSPEQYEANVITKKGSGERVEFAVKFPNREGDREYVWLPIDAKFPKDAYEALQIAYDSTDQTAIDAAQRSLEAVIKKMAKDICEKYIDAPNTTAFGIMFLPFEGLFAEVVRKASLLEEIQRSCNVVVTGPTTLAVILNSLQMGFRTLAIQKRSSEVWHVLSDVKKEFNQFGGLLEKAQNNIQTGLNQLDQVVSTRTRAINRKLRGVEVLENRSDEGSALSMIEE